MANQITKSNPSQDKGELKLPPGYKSMSVGQRRLEVTEREGWHRHWFRDTPGNIARAVQAGYTFVEKDDISLNDSDLAGGDNDKGTDMGSRVSVTSGDGKDRLILMECPEWIFQHAQNLHMEQVHATAEAIKGGRVEVGSNGETRDDTSKRYSDVNVKGRNLFTRKS